MKQIELVRQNVHKIAASEEQAKKYMEKGFKRVGDAPAAEVKSENVALNEMTLTELKELAKSKGVTGYSALKKDDLIQILEGDDYDYDESGKAEETD